MRYQKKKPGNSNLEGFLFALPWIIGFLLFSAYPIFMSGFYSFTNFSAIRKPTWIGLANYQYLFEEPLFYKSLYNTFRYVAFAIPLSIVLSLFLASLLNMKIKGQSVFRSIFFLPAVIPVVAATMIWVWMLEPMGGFLNRFLGIFGIPNMNWLGHPRYTMASVIIITLWGVGTTVIIFLAAMQDVPHELYESAEIDGAGSLSKFFFITVPGISHMILYQVILGIINGFQVFTQVYIIITSQAGVLKGGLGGGPNDSLLMYPLYLYQNAFSLLRMGRASAMAWILFIIVGVITLILIKTTKRHIGVQ
jgi:multiple sugar transport system permease protein